MWKLYYKYTVTDAKPEGEVLIEVGYVADSPYEYHGPNSMRSTKQFTSLTECAAECMSVVRIMQRWPTKLDSWGRVYGVPFDLNRNSQVGMYPDFKPAPYPPLRELTVDEKREQLYASVDTIDTELQIALRYANTPFGGRRPVVFDLPEDVGAKA